MSKDAILLATHEHAPWMFWVGVITAGMTAFYVWRALFLCFFGKPRGHHHAHESPLVMLMPLGVLALLSLAGGYFNIPHWLEPIFGRPHEEHETALVAISVSAGLAGIFLAWLFYVAKPRLADSVANTLGGFYRLVYNKYYVDEAYDAMIVHPIRDGSATVLWKGVDVGVIDGTVNGIGTSARGIGGIVRWMQSGNIRAYAAWVVAGAVLVLGAITVMGGAK
jgi:NADH-quinone oxidoreductase subunit L